MAIKIGSNTAIDDSRNGYFNVVYYTDQWLDYNPFPGENYGYVAGGTAPVSDSIIDRWDFASATTNAADVGDLIAPSRTQISGASSDDYGYAAASAPHSNNISKAIERWPFAAATTNAADVGDLTKNKYGAAGISSIIVGYGYIAGGIVAPGVTNTNEIERWPFASSSTNATDVGDLTIARGSVGENSSGNRGYVAGGYNSGSLNILDRWSYSYTSVDAADVGDLTVARYYIAGQNSAEYGYASGGESSPSYFDIIDRWSFLVEITNAADVGNLISTDWEPTGQSSINYAYKSGGGVSGDRIERWAFADSTTNAADVGSLTVSRYGGAGAQF